MTRYAKSDVFDVSVTISAKTERAVLVQGATRYTGEATWFPLSQIEIADNLDGTYTLTAPEWLLIEKGFL